MKHVRLNYMFVQDVVEKKQPTLACVNMKSNKADLMIKCHTFEAHMKGCAMLGLKLSRENPLKPVKVMRSGQVCLDLKVECRESRTFSATRFTVSSEFTFGDNQFVFMDLADCDLTAYLTHSHSVCFFSLCLLMNESTRTVEQTRGI